MVGGKKKESNYPIRLIKMSARLTESLFDLHSHLQNNIWQEKFVDSIKTRKQEGAVKSC